MNRCRNSECRSRKIRKYGTRPHKSGYSQRWHCRTCGKVISEVIEDRFDFRGEMKKRSVDNASSD